MSQLPEDEASAERFDEIFRALGEMDIEVVDAPERRKGADGEETAEEEASPEAELDLSPAPVGRTDDPVRMYLREMGRTPLLTREGEIRIAKRIEEGRKEVADSVCRAAAAVREILYLGERLEQGRLRIGDLLALNEFEEISEQRERDLQNEIKPVIRALKSEQAKVEEIRRRMEKAGPRPGERVRNKFDGRDRRPKDQAGGGPAQGEPQPAGGGPGGHADAPVPGADRERRTRPAGTGQGRSPQPDGPEAPGVERGRHQPEHRPHRPAAGAAG